MAKKLQKPQKERLFEENLVPGKSGSGKAGRHLTFALHQLFPKLNYPVIAGLDRIYLDAVDDAYQNHDAS